MRLKGGGRVRSHRALTSVVKILSDGESKISDQMRFTYLKEHL